jgi:two-component system CheB/CheR fusion protein
MNKDGEYHVVGIGASAGGLDAVQQFFDALPNNTGNAYVIVQHLSPDFKSLMPELLAKHTGMKIYTAKSNQILKPNCIYLNQRAKNLGIKNNKFVLFDKAPKDHLNLPIDILFHALGEYYKDKALGVILSGTGSDGSRGIKTIKEAGGTILVQDPESAQFNGMPNSAISTSLADFILPPKELAEKIVQFTGNRLQLDSEQDSGSDNERAFQAILSEIKKHSGVNFKKYKVNTLLRRLEKRITLHNIQSLKDYLKFIKQDEKERSAIVQEFLIGVTSFFRDREAFATLKNTVIPEICKKKEKHDIIRVWIPGSSSGEEVYSIALLFEDYIRKNKLGLDYKIFATDIDKIALQRASIGSYPVNNCAEIDKEYLEEYFLKSGDKIQIVKRIREKVVFSYHDLTNDPPFIKVDLISCRNLLIYFSNQAQKLVLAGFQFALNKNGFLFLGSSESLGKLDTLFRTIDNKNKIFQNLYKDKRFGSEGLPIDYSFRLADRSFTQTDNVTANTGKSRQNELYYYKFLSKKHAPVTVFIDQEFTVQFIMGDFKKWYSSEDGVYTNNLLNMVSSELSTIIRNGIRRLSSSKKSISIKNLVYEIDEKKISTDLIFEIVEDNDSLHKIFLVQFDDNQSNAQTDQIVLSNSDISNFSKQRIEDLEFELKENRNELQNVVEELEASNEELQSSNEELMSSNEELQSSNEELQSVNEELYTVNTEFQEKNKELENLNNDVNNLLNSTDIGTLFLDTNLSIRKFTPAIKRVFKLEESDIGRSIASFASEFEDDTRKAIISDSKQALEQLSTFEKEIRDNNLNWYLLRINPFITSDKKIEGVLLTFVDVSSLKQAESELGESEKRLQEALVAGNMAWWEMELPSGKVVFNKNKTTMIGRKAEDFKHYTDFINIVHPDDKQISMRAMQKHIDGKADHYECEYRIQNGEGKYQWFQDIGKIVFQSEEKTLISGIVLEITQKKKGELLLIEAKKKAEVANVYKNQFLANMSHEIRTPMNGLVGFAELLKDDNLSSEAKNRYVNIIESSSNQLLNLINDIIDVSKIEAGELGVTIDTCHVGTMMFELEDTFNEIKHQRDKKNVSIIALVSEEFRDLAIKTDPNRLKQVLSNLISNALKFTEEGEITFSYTVKRKKVVFTVQDTGIGIPKDKLELIFERFQQIAQPETGIQEGTGLGLAISAGIIELLGGKIKVSSIEGKGSKFTFELPYKPAEASITSTDKSNELDLHVFKNKKILIAEDDPINRIYLEEILTNTSLKTLWANNGAEALDLFKANEDLDLVVLDIRMPIMNGIVAANNMLQLKPSTRIIAQTAYAMEEDKERCFQAGFVDYISKPLQKQQLLEIIAHWI